MADKSITDAVLDKISSHIGASSETLQKVKFGRGTVGKLAIIGVSSLAAISLAAVHLTGNQALIGIGAMVVITLSVLGLILYVVVYRPELAVLEGTELVMYKQVTLGMKGSPEIPKTESVLPVPESVNILAEPPSEDRK